MRNVEPLADLKFDLDVGEQLTRVLQESEMPSCSRVELYSRNADFDAVHSYFAELHVSSLYFGKSI